MSAKKILVVDDSLTSLMWQRMILQAEQYEVVTARGGEEALAVAAAERPDLVLMDVTMPNMDGLEACRALRGRAGMQQLPVILIATRSAMRLVEQDGGASGHVGCLAKPIDREELLARVRRILGGPAVELAAPIGAAA